MYINEASKKSGTTKKAIEYYCQKGLLDPAVSDKGYRIFSDEDVEKLKKISLLRFPGNISNKQIRIYREERSVMRSAITGEERSIMIRSLGSMR